MKTNFLYHHMPPNMHGDILYPLNQMKDSMPEIYNQAISKYTGREHLTQKIIPILNCKWNDVLHFTAVPPSIIRQAREAVGIKMPPAQYFEIDPLLLESKNTIIYLDKVTTINSSISAEDCLPYNPHNIAPYTELPGETKLYYKKVVALGKHPLMYVKVPHILYHGTLYIKNIPIITV